MSALEAIGFYDIAEPLHEDVAALRRVLKDVVQAALYYRGPLHRPNIEDTLLEIGRAVDGLFE